MSWATASAPGGLRSLSARTAWVGAYGTSPDSASAGSSLPRPAARFCLHSLAAGQEEARWPTGLGPGGSWPAAGLVLA